MFKNTLQEMCQKSGGPLPVYSINTKVTPGNNPIFQAYVTVTINGNTYGSKGDWAASKKETEMKAAQGMLDLLANKDIDNRMQNVSINNVVLDTNKPPVLVQSVEPEGLSVSRPTLFIDIENCHLTFEKIYHYHENYDIVAVASDSFTKKLPKIVTLEQINSSQPDAADIHLIVCICKYHYEKNVTTAVILSNDGIFDIVRHSLHALIPKLNIKWIKQLPKPTKTSL